MLKRLSSSKLSLLALVLGVTLFTTAAFADLAIGSAYSDLKEALRLTDSFTNDPEEVSYTMTSSLCYSVNGAAVYNQESIQKLDFTQQRNEYCSSYLRDGVVSEHITIEDFGNSRYISKSSLQDRWLVIENYPYKPQSSFYMSSFITSSSAPYLATSSFRGSRPVVRFLPWWLSSSFDDPRSQDLERIVDALAGNLASLVHAETAAGSGKRYNATIIGPQLSPLLQALAGLVTRDTISGYELSSINIDQIQGEALQNSQGFISYASLQVIFSGKDQQGSWQSITGDFLFNLTNLGTTTVEIPDLHQGNADFTDADSYWGQSFIDVDVMRQPLLEEKNQGTYRSRYLTGDKDAWYVVMERYLTLVIDDDMIIGHYREIPKSEDAWDPLEFIFMVENNAYHQGIVITEMISGTPAPELNLFPNNPASIGFSLWFPDRTDRIDTSETAWIMVFD